jgi:pyruvate formate lyase activating enzyme
MDSERHAWATGVPNELILENARKIAAAGGRFHIRIPLIQGYNDDDENIEATRDFLLEIKDAVDLIQILPFHSYGEAKYDRLSMKAPEHGFTAPSEERIAGTVNAFEDAGFKVILH